MGRSINLYSYNYEQLTNELLKVCETNNTELVEKILLACGNKIGDRYILLNQEFWEEFNSYYTVASIFSEVFGIDDVFGKVFCTFDDKCKREELISAMAIYEVEEMLDINND